MLRNSVSFTAEPQPISRWSYKAQHRSIEHIGPMAQDLYEIPGCGGSDTTITTIDPDGISLAAAKELHRIVKELPERNERLEAELAELKRLLLDLLSRPEKVSVSD